MMVTSGRYNEGRALVGTHHCGELLLDGPAVNANDREYRSSGGHSRIERHPAKQGGSILGVGSTGY
jgi:hypothetical protein